MTVASNDHSGCATARVRDICVFEKSRDSTCELVFAPDRIDHINDHIWSIHQDISQKIWVCLISLGFQAELSYLFQNLLGPVFNFFFGDISIFRWKAILLNKGISYRYQLYLFKCI